MQQKINKNAAAVDRGSGPEGGKGALAGWLAGWLAGVTA